MRRCGELSHSTASSPVDMHLRVLGLLPFQAAGFDGVGRVWHVLWGCNSRNLWPPKHKNVLLRNFKVSGLGFESVRGYGFGADT